MGGSLVSASLSCLANSASVFNNFAVAMQLLNRSQEIARSMVEPTHSECFSSPILKLFSGELEGAVTSQPCFGSVTRKSSQNSAEPFMIGQAFRRYSRSPPKA